MNAGIIDQLYQAFAAHGPAIQTALNAIALELFGGLFIIELGLSVGRAIVAKTDIMDILALVTHHMLVGGFFLFLMQDWAQFAKAITDSFALAGGIASAALGGKATLNPASMVEAGVEVAKQVWSGMALTSPLLSVLLGVDGVIVVATFALFAALMFEVLIECFFASYVGVVMMAFGGNVYTRDMAISQARYAISVGVKRLTMQLIAGVSGAIVTGWATQIKNNPASLGWADCALMVAVPIVIIRLATTMPKIAQDVVMGSHLNANGNLFTTGAAVARAVTATAVSVTGAGAAVGAGAALASRAMGAQIANGTAPSTRIGQAAKMSGMAISATSKALAADVGKRMTGNYSAQHGHSGWRVAANLSQQSKDIGNAP